MSKPRKLPHVRAARVKPEGCVFVKTKTIGTNLVFDLETSDLSRSGMLLRWEHHSELPFLKNTILELTIDPELAAFHSPVQCLGRVVRLEKNSVNGATRYGVQIVQMEDAQQEQWNQWFDRAPVSKPSVGAA